MKGQAGGDGSVDGNRYELLLVALRAEAGFGRSGESAPALADPFPRCEHFGPRGEIDLVYSSADNRSMKDGVSLDDLRHELSLLEAEEARLSAIRRNLHNQIDFGYATETTRAREREISDQRRQLHQRIDLLRELLHTRPVA